jgi:hypothetical protein
MGCPLHRLYNRIDYIVPGPLVYMEGATMVDRYEFFNIQNCGKCAVRYGCPIVGKSDDKHLCDYEKEQALELLDAAEKEYLMNEFERQLVKEIIYQVILAQRIKGILKYEGVTITKTIKTKQGDMELEEQHPATSALHLAYHRMVRMLKEMKLTRKEKDPVKKNVNIKKMIIKKGKDGKVAVSN